MRNFNKVLTTRSTAEELDAAIEDLEARGWELVRRESGEREYRTFDRRHNSFMPSFHKKSSMAVGKHTALLRRRQPSE